MGFLNGDADNDGFLIVAFAYLKDHATHKSAHVKNLLARAKSIVRKYESAKKRVAELWENDFGGKKSELLAKQKQVEDLLLSFENATRVMSECKRLLGEKTARPYDAGIGLINKEDFQKAESLVSNFHWTPSEQKKKLNELIVSAITLLEVPGFPDGMLEALARAEAEVKKLDVLFNAGTDVEEKAKPVGAPAGASGNEALYEMAIAIGGVTACNHYQMGVTTPRTIFDILCILGKCGHDNGNFLIQLSGKIKEDSEEISDQKKVCARWKESGKTWVAFYPNGYRIKLSRKKLALSRSFLEKHGLHDAEIKAAAKKRKGKGEEALLIILKPD